MMQGKAGEICQSQIRNEEEEEIGNNPKEGNCREIRFG